MAELAVRNLGGEQIDTIMVSDEVFGVPVDESLMHQAVNRLQADRRRGTQKAKARGEVSISGAKPWRQKGTGRARQGSRSSPLWKGGGVAFAPVPRSYEQHMPKKMRRMATRSALSSRLGDNAIVVVDSLRPPEARTKAMVSALASLELSGKVLLVDQAVAPETARASRNIPGVEFKPASTLNIVDVLDHDFLVFSIEAIRQIEGLLAHANV